MAMQRLEAELEPGSLASQLGVDLLGVADLTPAQPFILAQCEKALRSQESAQFLTTFPRALSLGIHISDALVERLPDNRQEPRNLSPYIFHIYNVVNPTLEAASLRLTRWLQGHSFKALPLPASSPWNRQELVAIFSHKLAAHLSGLGWIGKNSLLITPHYGPRVRWITVLTDAPLETGTPLHKKCGRCRECVEVCPAAAFTGIEFDPSDPREARYDAAKCSLYLLGDAGSASSSSHVCGLCIAACPVGKPSYRKV
ncbi:MAG: epoxyqueuosine reductase [Chloroflexi bacterium]|nr:epoxyqueuosine reductase [Chloroflexota bacterium]